MAAIFKRFSLPCQRLASVSTRNFGGGLYANDSISSAAYDMRDNVGFCPEKTETRATNRFVDKIAVITGAAGNFGTACARRIASEGGNAILWDLQSAGSLAEELRSDYPQQKFFVDTIDVTDEEGIQNATNKIIAETGRIDLLFNNAGYQGDFTPAKDYSVADFQRILNINVTGVFIVLQKVANAMISQNPQGGSIVNTASMAAHGAPPNMIAYASSKAAVFHMTRVASKDFAQYNIRVNSISPAFIGPGFMWTRQVELQAKANEMGSQFYDSDPVKVAEAMIGSTPMQRYGSLDEVIGPVTFLLSDDASYLTGVDIQITGGMN